MYASLRVQSTKLVYHVMQPNDNITSNQNLKNLGRFVLTDMHSHFTFYYFTIVYYIII